MTATFYAIKNGTLYLTGVNSGNFEFGDGVYSPRIGYFSPISFPCKIQSVSSNALFTTVIDNEHHLWVFSNSQDPIILNNFFEMTIKTSDKGLICPINIFDVKFDQLCSSLEFTVAMDTSGRLWSWGSNEDCALALGLDNTVIVKTPTLINFNYEIKSVTCSLGGLHVLDIDGNIWSCGNNNKGQLGLGKDIYRVATLTMIESDIKYKDIFTQRISLLFLATDLDDNIYLCGKDIRNFDDDEYLYELTLIAENFPVINIICNESLLYIIDYNYDIWKWGGSHRQYECFHYKELTLTESRHDFVDVTIICDVVLAIDKNNKLWVNGDNHYGLLGLGKDLTSTHNECVNIDYLGVVDSLESVKISKIHRKIKATGFF